MPTVLTLRPVVPTVEAWQFCGQPEAEWPSWVKGRLDKWGLEMVHETPAGRQVVYWREWLVLLPTGEVWFYTEDEMAHSFGQEAGE
jgi:hypothetical protein